jgi:ABC-type antimicrobial peptide transport system permease subunit
VLADVARYGVALTGVGVLLGIGGALVATSILTRFLYEIARFDAMTYAGIAILVAAVGGIAAMIPAWRATRVDPAIVLRA